MGLRVHFRSEKGLTKSVCDIDFAKLSGELSGAICLEILVFLGLPPNCSEKSLVLFVRLIGFVSPFWPLSIVLYMGVGEGGGHGIPMAQVGFATERGGMP